MPSPIVPITLDKPRSLLFDFDACESLENALNGTPLLEVTDKLRKASLPTLAVALWAGLKHEDKALTISLTKKIVKDSLKNGQRFLDLSVPVIEAIDRSGLFGTSDEGNEQTTASEN